MVLVLPGDVGWGEGLGGTGTRVGGAGWSLVAPLALAWVQGLAWARTARTGIGMGPLMVVRWNLEVERKKKEKLTKSKLRPTPEPPRIYHRYIVFVIVFIGLERW